MTLFSRLSLADEELAAIGCVAVEAARLEEYVERSVWHALNVSEDAGRVLTQSRPISQHIRWLRELLSERLPAPPETIAQVCRSLTAAIDNRNTLLHGRLVTQLSEVRHAPPQLLVLNRHAPDTRKAVAIADAMRVAEALSTSREQLHSFLVEWHVVAANAPTAR